jgi:DNA modification methylase
MAVQLILGDIREVYEKIKDHSIDCVITSPPYYRQRDYGVAGQIGHEDSPEEYAREIANIFRLLWDKRELLHLI